VLTLLFGLVVDRYGAPGVAAVHAGLGLVAAGAWLVNSVGAGLLPSRLRPRGGQRTK